jgi:hypothetical protein
MGLRLLSATALSLLVLLGVSAKSNAEIVRDYVYLQVTGSDLAELVRNAGYQADEQTDADGNPMIMTRMSGLQVWVYGRGCGTGPAPRSCDSIQIYSGFATPIDDAKLSEWNRSKRFTRAWSASNGNARLTYDLFVSGITAEHFKRTVSIYDTLIGEFATHIGFR